MHLPADLQSTQWESVNKGLSGASLSQGVFQGKRCFLKITPMSHRMPVKAEYDRLLWLADKVPTPPIKLYLEDETHQYLVTEAVNGIDLLAYNAESDVLIQMYAHSIRRLHDLPMDTCPFVTTIDDQIAFAHRTIDNNQVNESLMDSEFKGRNFNDLLDEMIANRPDTPDNVVVHGDPYNDNILVNPNTGEIAAFIDVGMLAVADRYTDLAMIYDDIIHTFGDAGWQTFLKHYGLETIDNQRMRFYQIFNEFM